MARQVELRFEHRGVSCVADLFDELAPNTCTAIWDALPQGVNAFHSKYARNSVYTLVPAFTDDYPGLENPTLTPTAGDLCFFWFKGADLGSGGYGFTPDLLPASGSGFIAELSLHYARNNLLLSPDSGWVPGTLFGSVVEGLEEMAEACEDCWLNGVANEKLTFNRI